jgi:hypothetical protein
MIPASLPIPDGNTERKIHSFQGGGGGPGEFHELSASDFPEHRWLSSCVLWSDSRKGDRSLPYKGTESRLHLCMVNPCSLQSWEELNSYLWAGVHLATCLFWLGKTTFPQHGESLLWMQSFWLNSNKFVLQAQFFPFLFPTPFSPFFPGWSISKKGIYRLLKTKTQFPELQGKSIRDSWSPVLSLVKICIRCKRWSHICVESKTVFRSQPARWGQRAQSDPNNGTCYPTCWYCNDNKQDK